MIGMVTMAALATTPIDPASFMSPSGKWAINYAPDACTLSRTFGDAGHPTTLALQAAPLAPAGSARLTISLILPKASRERQEGEVVIAIQPANTRLTGRYLSAPAGQGLTVMKLYLADLHRTAIVAMSGLSIEARGFPAVNLATQANSSTDAAIETCNRSLLTSWSIDPDEPLKILTLAAPVDNEGEWIRVEDYPVSARTAKASGVSKIRWSIGLDGRAAGCVVTQSSGRDDLDAASCAAIVQRARYKPAVGSDGKPMITHAVRTVTWIMPG